MNPTSTEEAALLSLDELAARFASATRSLWPEGDPIVQFEPARRPEFGDVTTNVAFGLSRIARAKPQAIATGIIDRAMEDEGVRATVSEATPLAGFINLRLYPAFWQRVVRDVLHVGSDYGRGAPTGERISLEFGSANPTGPLVVVQGRTMSIGDTLARAMRHAGYSVFTEWIINDAGSQIEALGRSVFARYCELFGVDGPFPEDGYPGDYIKAIAESIRARDGDKWLHESPSVAVEQMAYFARNNIVSEQKAVAERFRAQFDLWQSERELHDAGAIERGLERLRELGILFKEDGATWLRTKDSGDDENRVVIRSDGRPTYFANDVAYHYDKLQRADHVIDILGPDHHGYIGRLNALATAYNRPNSIEVLIAQQITLRRGDEILSMSKRAGTVITLEDVVNEVGVDAARFFFLMTSPEQPLTFDLELAKRQTEENPVFYVQYAHTRIASLIRRASIRDRRLIVAAQRGEELHLLTEPEEVTLARRLHEFGRTVAGVARDRAPHRMTLYVRALASDWHGYYDKHRILVKDEAVVKARLSLAIATQIVLDKALEICGVLAPEVMEWGTDAGPQFIQEQRHSTAYSDIGYLSGLIDAEFLEVSRDTIKLLVRFTAAARSHGSDTSDPRLVPALNSLAGFCTLAIGEARALLLLVSTGLERPSRIHLRSLYEYLTRARLLLDNPAISRDFALSAASEIQKLGEMLGLRDDIISNAQLRFLGNVPVSESISEQTAIGNIRSIIEERSGSPRDYAIEYAWLSQVAHGSVLALDEVANAVRGTGAEFARRAVRDFMGPVYLAQACNYLLWLCALEAAYFGIEDKGELEVLAERLTKATQHHWETKMPEIRAGIASMTASTARPSTIEKTS